MGYTESDVYQFVEDNDVKFVRLLFTDIFGTPKNVAVMAGQLPRVFQHGAGFDVSAVDGFMNIEESDLLLYPDPASLAVLPWRPSTGRVVRMFCNIRYPGGEAFAGDGRRLVREAMQEAAAMGLSLRFGTECEFYLFEMDDNGAPTLRPHDNAGYLDIAPLDKCEKVRREVCLALEEMGQYPEGSHHEKGPGQNEIWCRSTSALACADDFITYKTVVRTIAAQNGLFASFMPKPLAGKSGNGLHINLALQLEGEEQMDAAAVEEKRQAFMAGILEHIAEMTLFLNTTTNSYQRFGSFDAPKYISWARGNRAQLLRVPAAGEGFRMELRSPDPLCNPYLAFTLLLRAGMEGVRAGAKPAPAANFDFAAASPETLLRYATLPDTLGAAIEAARGSVFISRSLPAPILEKILASKNQEWERCQHAENRAQFEHAAYFERM